MKDGTDIGEAGHRSRARGALLGLAIGDAAGFPALFHRSVRLGWRRSVLWRFALQLDEQKVLRSPLPFTLGRPEPLAISGTDDSEFLAIAAIILLETGGDFAAAQLFAGWQKHVVQQGDDLWSGIAERSSIVNAQRGLLPPETGGDNPAHFDDGAVARGVAVGVRFSGDPRRAAEVAERLAQITHSEDGVWAAAAMAASVAAAVGGTSLAEAIEVGRGHIPEGSWLSRQMTVALQLASEATSAFDLAAELSDRIANASYSFGTVAPETLPSAFALALAAEGDPSRGISAAATIAKQADSVPAMVGALTGAAAGSDALPASWASRVDRLRGICIRSVEGLSLTELAHALVIAQRHESDSVGSGSA